MDNVNIDITMMDSDDIAEGFVVTKVVGDVAYNIKVNEEERPKGSKLQECKIVG